MSRLMELAMFCKEQFVWKCCRTKENNTINAKKFGYNVRRLNNTYNSLQLICERNVYLSEKNETILKIGCSPQHFFEVFARIESKTKNAFILSIDELTDLMEFLNINFNENGTWKSPYENFIHQRTTSDMKYAIDMKPIELRTFSLHIGRKYLTIDEESLIEILSKKTYIEKYILLFKETQKSCETVVVNLLSHFCGDNTLKIATDMSSSNWYVQQFFNEVLNFQCECIVETSFPIEIGANFSEWFSKCVPIFIKTTMLNEVDRLESFSSSEWPHDKRYISVKKLAKSGLYFTGERDVVGCAFCNIQLHDWNFGDNPVLDHHKYSPKCPFLLDSRRCFNVPIGDEKQIERMLSILDRDLGYDVPN